LELERADAQEVLTLCALCGWEMYGSALESRHKAAEHRARAHPEINPKRRRPGRSLRKFSSNLKDEDLAEIDAARIKRAKLIGIELSGGTE
jgi:hypothetical protein